MTSNFKQFANNALESIAGKFNDEFNGNLLFSVRGIENWHVYLWLLKDLFWSLNYTICGTVFGISAMFFTLVIMWNRIRIANTEDTLFGTVLLIWLIGNFLWMRYEFIENNTNGVSGRIEAGWILISAFCFGVLYYAVLKWYPKNFIKNNSDTIALYVRNGYSPYFTFFENWKQYKFFHMVCWLTKDIGWCFLNKYIWFPAVILTLIISVDFIRYSVKGERFAMDLTHYIVQLIWLIGNIVWSVGEIFSLTQDTPHTIFNVQTPMTCRWVASVIFSFAFAIIIFFNFMWILLTKCKCISEERNCRDDGFIFDNLEDQI